MAVSTALLAVTMVIAEGEGRLRACEWCGADEASGPLTPRAVLSAPDEPGDRLTVSGTVSMPDGAPASDVIVYAYHADGRGRYRRTADLAGNGRRHGPLRGWARTDEAGRYEIETVRPAPYPAGDEPAHIHLSVLPAGGTEVWIDSIEFDDDPLLTEEVQASRAGRGGSGIVSLRDADGMLRGVRDIVLPTESLSARLEPPR